jgi:hypothetical protein
MGEVTPDARLVIDGPLAGCGEEDHAIWDLEKVLKTSEKNLMGKRRWWKQPFTWIDRPFS